MKKFLIWIFLLGLTMGLRTPSEVSPPPFDIRHTHNTFDITSSQTPTSTPQSTTIGETATTEKTTSTTTTEETATTTTTEEIVTEEPLSCSFPDYYCNPTAPDLIRKVEDVPVNSAKECQDLCKRQVQTVHVKVFIVIISVKHPTQ